MSLDWDGDPELKKLRAEFAASLPERLKKIKEALKAGGASEAGAIAELRQQAHKLAGLGGSYGYPELSELSAAIEDQIEVSPGLKPRDVKGATAWLAEIERVFAISSS